MYYFQSFDYFIQDLVGGDREKSNFSWSPPNSNLNKHLLGGLDFLDGLDASNQL